MPSEPAIVVAVTPLGIASAVTRRRARGENREMSRTNFIVKERLGFSEWSDFLISTSHLR